MVMLQGPFFLNFSFLFLLIGLVVVIAVLLVIRGSRSAGGENQAAPPSGAPPPTLVRVYRGREQADVTGIYQADAAALAPLGYTPVSQSWGQGQWSEGAVLLAVILTIFAVGLLILAYLFVAHPDGSLTVTYVRHDAIGS